MKYHKEVTRDAVPGDKVKEFLKNGRRHVEFEYRDLRCEKKESLKCLGGGVSKLFSYIGIYEKTCIKDYSVYPVP